MILKKRNWAKFIAVVLVLSLAGNCMPAGAAEEDLAAKLQNPGLGEIQGGELDELSGLRNPRVTMKTRDTITFGNYWQEDTNEDGVTDKKDEKKPIRWQVLSVKGDDAFLMSDQILDCKKYNTNRYYNDTWESSTLRTWLNNDFYNAAFSEKEKQAIQETKVINEDNPENGTEGGNDTLDKIYLLSLSEVTNPEYGFIDKYYIKDQAMSGKVSPFALTNGIEFDTTLNSSSWWLRSPGDSESKVAFVSNQSYVDFKGGYMDQSTNGIRPVLHISISSLSSASTDRIETAVEKSEWDVVELGSWEGKAIRWRVLSVNGKEVLLLADQVISRDEYHGEQSSSIWKDSTLRKWLNEEFYEEAFSESEKRGIQNFTWNDKDTTRYGDGEESKTTEYISLLSTEDIVKKEYGFIGASFWFNETRISRNKLGVEGFWWLRSPGHNAGTVSYVADDGSVVTNGVKADGNYFGVRPALYVDLSLYSPKKVGESDSVARDSYLYPKFDNTDQEGLEEEGTVRELQNPRLGEVQGGKTDGSSGLKNPEVVSRIRDTITFGNYWQEDTNGDGKADQKDEKQPICWQVLEVKDDDVFLMADKVLDYQSYNTERGAVTWEGSSIRQWLNGEFYDNAFTEEEKKNIKETDVINQGTFEGNDTKDKVYFLSSDEIVNPLYGFVEEDKYSTDQTRIGKATSYAAEQGIVRGPYISDKCCYWWLRSHEADAAFAGQVDSSGRTDWKGWEVEGGRGVRPVLHLKLSALSSKQVRIKETMLEESEWDAVELGTWKEQPIRWRVLSVKNNDVFLMADRVLELKQYGGATWKKSLLRKWLNNDFYKKAFSDSEKEGIKQYTWSNEGNPYYGTEKGSSVNECISLLSWKDVLEKQYGFASEYHVESITKKAYDEEGTECGWWLRSPDDLYNPYVTCALSLTATCVALDGTDVNASSGVRPVLHFDLSLSHLKKVGIISAKKGFTAKDPIVIGENGSGEAEPSKPSGGNSIDTGSQSGEFSQTSANQNQVVSGTDNPVLNATTEKGTAPNQNKIDGKRDIKLDKKPGKVKSLKIRSKKKRMVTFTWKRVSGAKRYQIQYSRNKKFKKAKKKTTTKNSCKITKLIKKKTWYFRIRGISATGKKGAWSKTVKVKMK